MSVDNSNTADPADASDDNSDSGNGAPDGTPKKSLEEVEAELAETRKRRDSLGKRLRELEGKLREREELEQSRQADDAAKSKDLDKIRENYKNDLAREKARAEESKSRLRNYVIRNEVARIAAGKVEGFEVFQKITEAENIFDVETDEDTGHERVFVKDAPDKPLAQWLDEYLTKNPIFKRNQRIPGAGVTNSSTTNDRTSTTNNATMADVEKSNDNGRSAFKKDTALAEKYLRSITSLKA